MLRPPKGLRHSPACAEAFMKDNRKRDTLVFKRPLPSEEGDVEGFDQLIALLD